MRNTTERALCSPGQECMASFKTLCAEEYIVSNIEIQTEAGKNRKRLLSKLWSTKGQICSVKIKRNADMNFKKVSLQTQINQNNSNFRLSLSSETVFRTLIALRSEYKIIKMPFRLIGSVPFFVVLYLKQVLWYRTANFTSDIENLNLRSYFDERILNLFASHKMSQTLMFHFFPAIGKIGTIFEKNQPPFFQFRQVQIRFHENRLRDWK